ncbi:MAG: hypothetical protein HRU25_16290 [Psychrobium sp.]|nr:hypothetical protein [Psychrobium sp.]
MGKCFSIVVVIAGLLSVNKAYADEFEFIWNPYCPYTCDAQLEDGKKGIAIDILDAIFEQSHHTVRYRRIDNWLRAKLLVSKGEGDGMAFSFYPVDVEDFFIVPSQAMIVVGDDAYISQSKHAILCYNAPGIHTVSF